MKLITIDFKSKTNLIEALLQKENIKVIKKKTLIEKLTFKKDNYAQIYFHSGKLEDKDIKKIENSKFTIVNSYFSKNKIIEKFPHFDNKIEVLYPSINMPLYKEKEIKKQLYLDLKINSENKIIFFTAKNFKTSGIKEFIDIISNINYKNIQVIIAGDNKQITALKFQVSKLAIKDKILFLEDYKQLDKLYYLADIFILPTHSSAFATNILKAMFAKCAVFISSYSSAREVVDVFSTMNTPSDGSTVFKVDALLGRKEDLKLIKKQNKQAAQEFTLDKSLEKMHTLIQSV
ncbi:glycosyltransferase family 4 protein [Malaciobacter mytili]|uniref:glycosyltransferase family 4 protein n=1 Tax=Malaciobacter mytili TaxID=603050 RepID=UPI003BAF747E